MDKETEHSYMIKMCQILKGIDRDTYTLLGPLQGDRRKRRKERLEP